MSSTRNKVRGVVIALLTVTLLFFFLWKSDLGEVGRAIAGVNPWWLVAGFGVNVLALLLRALRWRIIVRPSDPPGRYDTFFATTIGFMASAVLPVRAGDLIRPALLSRRTDIRFSTALGTVLTERVLDLSSILLLYLIFVGWSLYGGGWEGRNEVFVRSSGAIALAILLALVIIVILALRFRPVVRRPLLPLARILPEKVGNSLLNFFDSFADSLRFPRGVPLLSIFSFTALIWICLTSQFYFVMLAFGSPLPFVASFFITAMTVIGFAIPTPGGIGGFHKVCQLVLMNFYGFGIDESVAIALVYHVVGTAPVLVVGGLLFVREGLSWKQIEEVEKAELANAGIETSLENSREARSV